MRVAVLVYGRLGKCASHYKNIIDTIGSEHTIDFFASSDNSPNIDEFVRIYKPISYVNDKIETSCNLEKYPRPLQPTNVHNVIRHFINKHRVLSLLEKHGAEYDAIISLRIDCVFNGKFKFDSIKDNTIYIPEGYDYYGINDQIAYGNLNVMKMYNSIFLNISMLLEKGLSILHPESLTLANIRYNKLQVVRVSLPYFIQR